MYESHADWISHMEKKHACWGWVYYDESHDSTQYFEDEQSFRRHIIEHHGGDVTDDELANLTKACKCLLPFQLFKSCPFCSEYTDDVSIDLDEHITLHLLYLSQVSIPRDFLEMESVEFESEEEILSSGNRLEGGKLSHKCSLGSISSFRTPKRGTSASSSINSPELLKTNEDAVATLTELESLAKKRGGKDQYHTTVEAVGEPSADNSSVAGPEVASCLHYCSVLPNMGLSGDILEPPTIEYTAGEPDIWDRLQVRERPQGQENQKSLKYNAEIDSTLWNFRLRYILGLETEDSDSSWMDEVAVIESCLQLADALDAHGRYSEVEEILTKIFSDKATLLTAIL